MNPTRHLGTLGMDIETASACEIKLGAWAYSLHPSTRAYCVVFGWAAGSKGYAFERWEPGQPIPERILERIREGAPVLAHNYTFEASIWANILVPLYGFPPIELHQWQDTQVLGLAVNLPLTLEGLARALGCPAQKDMEGSELMKKMIKTTPDPNHPGEWLYPFDTPENRHRLADYCEADVATMLDCYERLPALSLAEEALWRADQEINDRGVYLDRAFADQCLRVSEARRRELDNEAFSTTAGELVNSRAAPALKRWLTEQGVTLPKTRKKKADGSFHMTETADKKAVAEMLKSPSLSDEVRALLTNRIEANKVTSLAKLKRVEGMVDPQGRLRNSLQYCGAGTGRWTSWGLQVHNLPKDKMGRAGSDLVRCVLSHGSLEGLKLVADRPLDAISQSLRSVIAAPPGKELIAADYSAIEAVVIAWLAGQDDILEQFRARNDVYVYAASRIGSTDRQLGKVCQLALGFGMGDLKFFTTSNDWGCPITLVQARRVKNAWRASNHAIVQFWRDIEDAVRDAIAEPDKMFPAGPFISAVRRGACLYLVLPSGRSLRYWRPKVVRTTKTLKLVTDEGDVIEKEVTSDEIRYYAMGDNKKDMLPESTYGGKLAENVTQATARDLLGAALVRFRGISPYDVVMHVHDSIAAEVPKGEGSVEEFCEIMSRPPAWAAGAPINVEGYRDTRFRG